MITSKAILVADRIIRDSESGNLSIINILEDISAESYPILIQRISLVVYLNKDADDASKKNLDFKIYNNEKVIGNHTLKVDFREKNKTKTIIQLGALPFNEPGEAYFVLTDIETGVQIDKYSINLRLREDVKVIPV